jgi:hypothetical protein
MTLSSYQLPAPSDWQAFERFTRDLFSAVWDDPRAQANGRGGQPQAGVDVFGINSRTTRLEGVQCKGKDSRYGHSVSVLELQDEVKRALTFAPQLSHYYLVTSGAADVAVQQEARRISDLHSKVGLFGVEVYSWDQLLALLQDHSSVARKHYRALHVALSEINAPAELIAICHQSFQSGSASFLNIDAVAAADGFYPVQMDASVHYEGGVLDAKAALASQRNLFRDIAGHLRAHPTASVAYFGIAHIPLTMHAGVAASTKQAIRLYELDAASGNWEMLADGTGPDLGVELVDCGGPVGALHAVIQVEVSARVAKREIDQTITQPYRYLVVRIAVPKRGVVTHHDQARALANKFREAVDRVHNENPSAIQHIFAAVPVSVSFRLGQMVSQTMHRSVFAYNYSQRSVPPYHWAVDLVAADNSPGQLWLSNGDPHV